MSEELTLLTAIPAVTLAKAQPHTHYVEVRAVDDAQDLSVHYQADEGEVPRVHEKLLVAVLVGIDPAWLDPPTNQPTEPAQPNIRFEAMSVKSHGGIDPSRAEQHDTLHIGHATVDGMNRLSVVTTNESGSVNYARIVLSKGQVTSMLAALLAIYPRLHEDGSGMNIGGDAEFARQVR